MLRVRDVLVASIAVSVSVLRPAIDHLPTNQSLEASRPQRTVDLVTVANEQEIQGSLGIKATLLASDDSPIAGLFTHPHRRSRPLHDFSRQQMMPYVSSYASSYYPGSSRSVYPSYGRSYGMPVQQYYGTPMSYGSPYGYSSSYYGSSYGSTPMIVMPSRRHHRSHRHHRSRSYYSY